MATVSRGALTVFGALIAITTGSWTSQAASATVGAGVKEPTTEVAVPTRGCPTSGMSEDPPAPKLAATIKTKLPRGSAKSVTWYQAGVTGGALAPNAWSCRAFAGSSGSTLYIGPSGTRFDDESRITGPVVVKNFSEGGTSGRFLVAAVAARAFPAFKSFAQRVAKEAIGGEPKIVFSPFEHDRTSRISDHEITFETAAGKTGLGTMQNLAPGATPVFGLASMSGKTNEPVLMLMQVRLGAADADLIPIIIDNLRQGSMPLR